MIVARKEDLPGQRACVLWLLLVACAWLLVLGPPVALHSGFALVARLLYATLAPVCHQLASRSFLWLGYPLGLCARCTGLLLGFSVGVMWIYLRRRGRPKLPHRAWLLGSGAFLGADSMAPWLGLYANTHMTRCLTGWLFGACVAPCAVIAIAELLEMIPGLWKKRVLA